MKQFFKYVFATIVGIVLLFSVGMLLMFASVIGMTMSGSSKTIQKNSVLVMKLSGSMSERNESNPLSGFIGGSMTESFSLEDAINAIQNAKENKNVKGIYLEGGEITGASPAMLQELRDNLEDFKKSGKFIVSYADTYGQGAYYLCSVADSVVINPYGMLEWKGLGGSIVYYKKLMDKLGVKSRVFKVGTYKSAVEPYMLDGMSDENREQMTVYYGEIWKQMLDDVAASRKVPADKLNQLADSGMLFAESADYKKNKLIDKTAYSDDVKRMISYMMGVDDVDDYNTVTVEEMANASSSKAKDSSGNIIAVYYAYGNIVEEKTNSLSSSGSIVSKDVCRDLEKLAENDNVKAVVLRVNSGGGSAYASEQIWHQVMKIKSKKPVVVSMGGMAASGGYYISSPADWIVAEPTTLTGSIGIFGLFPDMSELVSNKLGLKFETVKTNKYADITNGLTGFRTLDDDEAALMQKYINNGYELFTKRVADGRKKSKDYIKSIAEGRVWTGEHAKKIGLVDQLGGLDDAIEMAMTKAGVGKCSIMTYPSKASMFENLLSSVSTGTYADAKLKETFGEYYDVINNLRTVMARGNVQAALPYEMIFDF